MSLSYQLSKKSTIFPDDKSWLIPLLNNFYEKAIKKGKIITYSKFGINCEYALVNSLVLQEKDVKSAMGFGIAFPLSKGNETKRIIIFEDLLDLKYIDIAVGHEFSHKIDKKSRTNHSQEKKAFSLELEIADKIGKKEEWIKYNEQNYPKRIKEMREIGLIK